MVFSDMKQISTKQLRTRWKDSEIEPLRTFLPASDFPMAKGLSLSIPRDLTGTIEHEAGQYVDIRGFPLGSVAFIHDQDLDFSFAKSPEESHNGIEFIECRLKNCLFENVQNVGKILGALVRCSFTGARMEKVFITAEFDDCSFEGANIRNARCYDSKFRRCSFQNANLIKAEFGGATFDHCDFRGAQFGSGAVLECRIIGCNLADVDLADTMRDEKTFYDLGCELDGLRCVPSRRIYGYDTDMGPPPRKRAEA
ncbi:MAG: pentapeptide repeat-containing protein [Gemmataceae bacterium]|nr:pentapeptide repeat-containing protein [Gemmataceae bacterium]